MNENFDSSERSSAEITFFGVGCVGVFVTLAGLVVASIPAVMAGGFLIAVAVAYFLIR